MEQFDVVHLPVVSLGKFVGLICEEEILSMEKPTQPFRLHQYEFPMICIREDRHLYDALKIMSEQNLSVLPVINNEMSYLGSITMKTLLKGMATLQSVHEPGAVVILEMNALDYSLSQIAQIVEGNDAKILSATLTSSPNSTKVEVTLKINKQDLNPILQTFYRYEYTVVDTYMEPRFTEDLRDRYEEFMKFLNM
jgi:predicted transcriptional regulator